METPSFIRQLQAALADPLPGTSVQHRMAHAERLEALTCPVRSDVRKAAVLLLLYSRNASWHTVLIERKSIAGDVHSGQISLPGGRMQQLESPEEAALRETSEEIGCPPDRITTIGQLTELHIPVSNHLVFPVVGHLHHYAGWVPQESEVEQIVEIPLRSLQASNAISRTSIRLADGLVLRDVPAYQVAGQVIWGATAMILSEFTAMIEELSL